MDPELYVFDSIYIGAYKLKAPMINDFILVGSNFKHLFWALFKKENGNKKNNEGTKWSEDSRLTQKISHF
mgnify:CR=1 FL=1